MKYYLVRLEIFYFQCKKKTGTKTNLICLLIPQATQIFKLLKEIHLNSKILIGNKCSGNKVVLIFA